LEDERLIDRKFMKTIVITVIASYLILSITGCVKTPASESSIVDSSQISSLTESQSPSQTEQDGDGLPEVDMEGYVFTVADTNEFRWRSPEVETEYSIAIRRRTEEIESRFNITVDIKTVQAGSFFQTVQPALMAGDKYADIMIPNTWNVGYFLTTDLLTDWKNIPHIKLDKEYWNKNATELLTVGDKILGSAADFIPHILPTWGMYFNKRLIDELKLESPYDLVKEGKWTLDKFREMSLAAKSDLNGDGIMDTNDRYGFAGPEQDMIRALFMGTGLRIVDENQDGTYRYTMTDSKNIDVINKLKQMIQNDGLLYPKPAANAWTDHRDAFMKGQSLFFATIAGFEHLREMEDDFGMVYMPSFDGENYYCAVDHNAPVVIVPSTNTDLDKVGIILEALAYRSQEDLEIIKNEKESLLFRDEESIEIYRSLPQHMAYDKFSLINMLGWDIAQTGVQLIMQIAWTNPEREAASSFAAVEEMAQTYIDEYFNIK